MVRGAVWASCLALVIGAMASWATAAGLPVASRHLVRKAKGVDVTIAYPHTGVGAIDNALAAYAGRVAAEIGSPEDDGQTADVVYSLDLTYDVARNDGRMFVVMFTGYADTGGAHPNDIEASFNFLLPDGDRVYLPEILAGQAGLKRVSDLAIAQLTAHLRAEEGDADIDWIHTGAGPSGGNFEVFEWLPGELRIFFPSYQVASHASGVQKASIPLSDLAGLVRPDWRAPAPSFDCARASTAVEHAICADRALARLDRRVSEAYVAGLTRAADEAAKAAARRAQREWLAMRDKTCAAQADCLARVYADRLKALGGES
jgi:uncharacterized protein YecT (DUF1311 family)